MKETPEAGFTSASDMAKFAIIKLLDDMDRRYAPSGPPAPDSRAEAVRRGLETIAEEARRDRERRKRG